MNASTGKQGATKRGDRSGRRRRGGYLLIDVMMGIAIVGVMAIAMAVAADHQRRASRRLADYQTTVRLAEQVLTDMQLGRPVVVVDQGVSVTVQRVDGGAPIPGQAWVQVTATRAPHVARLVGLAPVGAIPSGRVEASPVEPGP